MRNVASVEIGFCVENIERSLAFYMRVLGLSFVSEAETTKSHAIKSGLARCMYRVVRLQFPTGERLKLFMPAELPHLPSRRPHSEPLGQVGSAFSR